MDNYEFHVWWRQVPSIFRTYNCACPNCDGKPFATWTERYFNEDGSEDGDKMVCVPLCEEHAEFADKVLEDVQSVEVSY